MAFSYSSAINNLVAGAAENVADVVTCFNDVKAVLSNGITGPAHLSPTAGIVGTQLDASANILNTQLDATTVLDKAGVSSGVVRRGKTNISATETRTNAAYGTLTTPDQVSNVVLPVDGLIAVAFQGTWREGVANQARAAIFIGANQVTVAPQNSGVGAAPVAQEIGTGSGGTINQDVALSTYSAGLNSEQVIGANAYTGNVTTGQVVGNASVAGPCYIFAAAGTYNVSIQFKAAGGVVVQNRKLWVWTFGF